MAWLEGFNNRIKLTIPPDKVEDSLTDFPVMLNLSSDSGRTGYDATAVFDELSNENYKKIAVTTSDGETQCPVEVEYWSSVEETAVLWTKVPTVYSSVDTDLYLYYDNTATTNSGYVGDIGETPAQQVWDNNFIGVWHMSQDPSGGADCILDSTASGIHGTPHASMTTGDLVDGKTGKALELDGIDDYVDTSNLGIYLQGTYEAVFKWSGIAVSSILIGDQSGANSKRKLFNLNAWVANELAFLIEKDDGSNQYPTYDVSSWTTGDWHSVCGTWDSSSIDLYTDGIWRDDYASPVLPTSSPYSFAVGRAGAQYYDDIIDEVRVSNVVRSAAWIKATYHSNWDNFVVFQDEEVTTSWLTDWSKRMKLTIDNTNIDHTLTNFPLAITLASGTNAAGVFNELSVPVSGTVDSYTKLLLPITGDSSDSAHTLNCFNGVKIQNSTVSGSNFTGSMYFDGTNDYIRIADSDDFDFGTGDFTIDFWFRGDNPTVIYPTLISTWAGYSSGSFLIRYDNTGYANKITVHWNPEANPALESSSTFSQTEWHHVAVIRESNVLKLYVNGQLEDTYVPSVSNGVDLAYGGYVVFGWSQWDFGAGYYKGSLSEVRISKGIARWTSNFTPEVVQYESDSYTKLLLHFEGDTSLSQHDVGLVNTQINSSIGKFDNSYYFDGSGDYISLPNNTDFNVVDGDFTIDCWFYLTNTTGNKTIFASQSDFYLGMFVGGNRMKYFASSTGSSWDLVSGDSGSYNGAGTIDLFANKWHHVAFVRNGDNWLAFIDGVIDIDIDVPGIVCTKSEAKNIGRWGNNSYWFLGYMSEFRFSKGIARWTSNFMPPNAPYGYEYAENEKKIAITTNDGLTQCPVEIEKWDWSESAAVLWSKVPVIHPDGSTILYLYYDKTKSDNTTFVGYTGSSPAQSVWNSNFVGVWHLAQNPRGSILDSTSNNNNGVSAGAMLLEDLVDGKIGKAIDFDGGDDYINCGNGSSFSNIITAVTISAWVKSDTDSTDYYILAKKTPSAWTDAICAYWSGSTDQIRLIANAGVEISSNAVFSETELVYIAITSTQEGTTYFYKNGAPAGSSATSIWSTAGSDLFIGARMEGAGSLYSFDGLIDEVRISKIVHPASWIKAAYYSDLDDIITYGEEQQRPTFLFYGYVKVKSLPAARTVYLFRRSTGELMGSVISNSVTGYFEIGSYYNDYHFVVILPELTEGYNLLSYDQIHPGV